MTESPPKLPPLRDVIREHGLGARKSLGQHFLLDANLTQRIARAAGDLTGRHVIEVGPGPGGLTRGILENHPASLHAIERDDRCIAALQPLLAAYPDTFSLINEDALSVVPSKVAPAPRVIIANLPYNISTPLLIGWLDDLAGLERMVLMFQSEVAERICAEPATSNYGRLAVMVQWLCKARILFNVDRRAFTPPPKVTSTVIELIPREAPLFEAEKSKLEAVTRAAFGQRRKMLRSSLKSIDLDPAKAGIEPTLRAEQLSIEQFCALARML